MKKLIFGILIGVSSMALISAGVSNYVASKQTADVSIYQNVRVFTDCKPVSEYEYLGTVKVRLSVTGEYTEVRDILLKNAKKDYPNCEGIIIAGEKADVIRFK